MASNKPKSPSSNRSGDPIEASDVGEWNPDSVPFVPGYDVEASEDERSPLSGSGVPAVVAVVVTRDPGQHLEATLESIESQEYSNLAVLVIDAGTGQDLAPRVATVNPRAFVKRVDADAFGEAANEVARSVEGAAFFLFLHDDSALGPGAVQAMVEEAFRSNAGVVGAKLVDWNHPDRIQSVGSSVDKFGFAVPVSEPLEKDQGQHDAVREVFLVSTACMLVRSDLFSDLNGFSTDLEGSSEDLDFCWRARVAGARVIVMPAAKVRHRGTSDLADAQVADPAKAFRGQARVILSVYTPIQMVRVIPQALALSVLDALWALVRGRFAVAWAVLSALTWNIGHLPRTLRVRGHVKRIRRTSDDQIRKLQVSGSTRVKSFLRSQVDQAAVLSRKRSEADVGEKSSPVQIAAALICVMMFLIGTRGLWMDGVPVLGDFAPFSRPSDLLTQWWTGWHDAGLGSSATSPTLSGVAGLLGWLAFGSTGFVRTALIVSPIAIGTFGAWRVGTKMSKSSGGLLAVAYCTNPVPYNALAAGRWQSLVVYAAVPFIAGVFLRVAEPAVFASHRRSATSQIVLLGVVVSLAFTIAPFVAVMAALIAAATVLYPGSQIGRSWRTATLTLGAGLFIVVMVHLPWLLALVGSPNRLSLLFGGAPIPADGIASAGDVVRLINGSHGTQLSVALVVVGVLPILFARDWRFRVAGIGCSMIVMSTILIALSTYLGTSLSVPPVASIQPLLVFGAALGCMAGIEAFRVDVLGSSFGWRQVLFLVGSAGLVLAIIPTLFGTFNGRWGLGLGDIDSAVKPLAAPNGVDNSRILWVGRSDAMSVRGWTIDDDIHVAVTLGPRSNLSSLFQGEPRDGERALFALVSDVSLGREFKMGDRLAEFGIRYVVVVERNAPVPYGDKVFPTSPRLKAGLAQQTDLASVNLIPGFEVYENTAWAAVRSIKTTDEKGAVGRLGVLEDGDPPDLYSGPLPGGPVSVLVASNFDDGWSMGSSAGQVGPTRDGWSMKFDTDSENGELSYSTSTAQVLLHLLQFLTIGSLPVVAVAGRRIARRRRRTQHAGQAGPLISMKDQP